MARYDADYFTKDCFAEKFELLLDVRYRKLDKHKRRGQFETDYNEYYQDDIHSSVNQWFSRRQRPSIEKLMNICELLDCDIDYFLTAQKEFKKNVAHASETTGLKYKTIELLEKIKKNGIKIYVIDELLNHKDFEKLITNIWEYTHSQNNEIMIIDTINRSRTILYSGNEQKEIMKYKVSEIFGKTLDDIYNSHQPEAIQKKLGTILLEMRTSIESCINKKDDKFTRLGLLKMASSYQNKIKSLSPDYGLCKFSPEEIIDNFDNLKEQFM